MRRVDSVGVLVLDGPKTKTTKKQVMFIHSVPYLRLTGPSRRKIITSKLQIVAASSLLLDRSSYTPCAPVNPVPDPPKQG